MLSVSAFLFLFYLLDRFQFNFPSFHSTGAALTEFTNGFVLIKWCLQDLACHLCCIWYTFFFFFTSNSFCPVCLSSIPWSNYCFILWTLPLNVWKHQESLLDSSHSLPFHLWKAMNVHDFTYNLSAVFLDLSHCFWFQDSHIQPSVWHLDNS